MLRKACPRMKKKVNFLLIVSVGELGKNRRFKKERLRETKNLPVVARSLEVVHSLPSQGRRRNKAKAEQHSNVQPVRHRESLQWPSHRATSPSPAKTQNATERCLRRIQQAMRCPMSLVKMRMSLETNREKNKTKLKRKEGAIRSKKIGAPPLITLNLQSILVGKKSYSSPYSTSAILISILARIVVTISKNSSFAQAEVGRLSLEERLKLQFHVARWVQDKQNSKTFGLDSEKMEGKTSKHPSYPEQKVPITERATKK
ncbi:hypothetical protein Ahy_A06g027450 isoform B [Arachis hypogaea]|uniref:Uncharacterized protein n=1 Tax=Arachis hypogaea TaxID=3818 RepID=A0A445CNP5_ARAHY|nr:hypothetical protein Ahy_A06g027450 isoform B [Arachis hypogaea]